MYPSLIGLDPWTHRTIVLEGVEAGNWSAFPVWQGRVWYEFIAAVMKTTGADYRLATMVVSFIQVTGGASLLFLIGKRVIGIRVGLLAALVIALSSWHIFFGYWIIPNGMGLILLLLAVYLVVKHNSEGSKQLIGAFAVAVTLLVFTYPMAVTWLMAILGIWVILTLVRNYRLSKYRVALPLAGVGAMALVLGTTGFFHHLYNLVFVYNLSPSHTGATLPPGLTPESPPPTQAVPLFINTIAQPSWELTFNSLGMMLGFAVAIAGCLWLLSKRYRNTPSLLVVLSFCLFLAMGVIPALFGKPVIEHRWWYAAQAFAAIPVAVVGVALHKIGKGAVTAIVVAILCFLMMIGLPCNMDNYTFSENQLARYALTQGELDAVDWAVAETDGEIGVDNYYMHAANLLPEDDRRLVGINTEILSNDYDSLGCDVVLMRDAVAYEPFALGEGCVYRLLYDPNVELVEAGYELVYSGGGVNGYVRRESAGESGGQHPSYDQLRPTPSL